MTSVISNSLPTTRQRITSIDALRAVILLGILLVHIIGMFGWGNIAPNATIVGQYSFEAIFYWLTNRCAAVFAILFGVSFHLILLNPTYTTKKFVWRCFLLALIGLFNKIFYTSDALFWYGIWGMVLAAFRNLSVRKLWISFFVIFVLNLGITYFINLRELVFGTNINPNSRYVIGNGLGDVICYPVWRAVYDYVFVALKAGPLYCLSIFLLGFCLGKSGIIEKLNKYATIKYFLLFAVLYLTLFYLDMRFHPPFFKRVAYLFGAFCYAELFLLIYYRFYPHFRFFEPYGKLGLTNYSMQGIVGVVLTGQLFVPYHWPFEYVLITMLLFYALQVVFSIVWLKYHKYGPFEWLWRCATERKWFANRK